jgi:hypothetical protein
VLGIFYALLDAHPVAAFAFFPALIAVVGVIERQVCCRQVAAFLVGAVKVAPAEPVMRRVRYATLISVVILTAAMWWVLRTYDERLGVLSATSDAVVFYRSISAYLLGMSVCVLFGVIFVTGWSLVRERHGLSGTLLILLLLPVAAIAFGTRANAIFQNPQPVIALTQSSLNCGWRIAWADITALSVESGDHDRTYVQIRLASGSSARCELDHLTADPDDMAAAMRKQWLVAAPSAASVDGITARLPDVASGRH